MTTTLTESLAQREQSKAHKRTDDWRLYREVLARRAAPDDGDLDALAELQERLGKSETAVRADIALLDTEARIHRDIKQIQALTTESLAAQEKRTAYRTKLDALEKEQTAEMNRLEHECTKLGFQLDRLRRERPDNELRLLRGEHHELFGVEPPASKPVQDHRPVALPYDQIAEARRRREAIEASGVIGPRQSPVGCDVQAPPPIVRKVKPRVRSADNAA